jgi:hypothetical protein
MAEQFSAGPITSAVAFRIVLSIGADYDDKLCAVECACERCAEMCQFL